MKVDALGYFVPRDLLFAKVDQLISFEGVIAFSGHHGCPHGLAPALIGHAKCSGLEHPWVLVQHFFNLGAVDVFAARHNHVFTAVYKEHVAVCIHVTEISRPVAVFFEHCCGLFVFVPIAAHYVGPASNNFTDLTQRQ